MDCKLRESYPTLMVESEPSRMLVALDQMPKAELHLHLEGAPRWSTLREALHRI
ncbi:hypothetical protein J0895_20220 [Phormidium pseudopriestleyi FRX01]|uniref:Adenosine deaminase n=1 Tax=Phormidium pseudopriestleyi FRX01 TaxID=1759528 RepID=A0ABS3FW64_9CYAN|nr:hypothetical protein [Phormidium pseudopriestleyi]MBO0351360.1 hypothetical protein [Phormidium pseudopriestleyi FRX01]